MSEETTKAVRALIDGDERIDAALEELSRNPSVQALNAALENLLELKESVVQAEELLRNARHKKLSDEAHGVNGS
jgi:predicted RNA-binding protein with EMAP domain